MHRSRALALVLAVTAVTAVAAALALANGEPLVPGGTPVGPTAPELVAHRSEGVVDVPGPWRNLTARIAALGVTGAEPTLGITTDGAVFVTGGGQKVWKSLNAGATWRDVSPPRSGGVDHDPYVWVDRDTDRVYSVPLALGCSDLKWSDDGGARWNRVPTGGCGLPGHDHQSLVTGPPPPGVTPRGYPNVVYYTYNSLRGDGTWLTTSLDGGASWSPTGTAVFPADCHGGLNGVPATAADGTVFVVKPGCDGVLVAASRDLGATWRVARVDDAGIGGGAPAPTPPNTPVTPNPSVAVDDAGRVFVAWTGADGAVHVARSDDGAASFAPAVRASPPTVNVTAFSALVATGNGGIAVAYLATAANATAWPAPRANDAPADAVWHLYVTVTLDAMSDDPTFTTLRVTPANDPVQVGCVSQSSSNVACRNLADYISAVQVDGRVVVAFTDGCRACSDAADSSRRDLALAVLGGATGLTGEALVPWP